MLKLVALCAVYAAVAAEPGFLQYVSPVTTYSSVLSPASTTISQQASSVIHPSRLVYTTPLAYSHFIKKRSAPALSYPISYIGAQTYAAPGTPLLTSTYTTPYITTAPLISQSTFGVHLIKKRSASAPFAYLAPQTYAAAISPQTYAVATALPLLKTTYTAGTPLISSAPLISQPITYTHLIKKRSAPTLISYSAPVSYSHQSRIDLETRTPYSAISYVAPITYSSPIAVSHVLKK